VPRCTAGEYAIVNYLEKELSPKLVVSFRSEALNDRRGQRASYTTKYSENTLSITKCIGSTIEIRPELRFEHPYDQPAYDSGRTHSQFTAASDLIFHFLAVGPDCFYAFSLSLLRLSYRFEKNLLTPNIFCLRHRTFADDSTIDSERWSSGKGHSPCAKQSILFFQS
jgi:hypothetical protein